MPAQHQTEVKDHPLLAVRDYLFNIFEAFLTSRGSLPFMIAKQKGQLRFQVLTAARMKMTVSWDVAPYSLVDV
jgi:hypothetical protein